MYFAYSPAEPEASVADTMLLPVVVEEVAAALYRSAAAEEVQAEPLVLLGSAELLQFGLWWSLWHWAVGKAEQASPVVEAEPLALQRAEQRVGLWAECLQTELKQNEYDKIQKTFNFKIRKN